MSSNNYYIPILKWKQGESIGLRQISKEIKPKFRPLIVPFVYKEPYEVINEIEKYWGLDHPIYVFLDPFLEGKKNREIESYIKTFFNFIQEKTTKIIPTFSDVLNKEIYDFINDNSYNLKNGLAIRSVLPDFDRRTTLIKYLVEKLVIGINSIDLIIDLGQLKIPKEIRSTYIKILKDFITDISKLGFRSLTLAGSSFPESLGGIPKFSKITIQRLEWGIWQEVTETLQNYINFGDYGPDDPNIIEFDPTIKIIPTIRYTIDDCWLIIRGEYDKKKPRDYTQFHKLSAMLVKDKDVFCGPEFSWADKKIYECANKECTGPKKCNHGNLTSWVQIATNHHITYVVNQLFHNS